MPSILKRFSRSQFSFKHLAIDGTLVACALYLSLWTRLGSAHFHEHLPDLNRFVGLFVVIRLLVFLGAGVYRCMWRYVSSRDAVRLAAAVGFSTLIFISVTYLLPHWGYLPRSLFIIDTFVATALLCSVRIFRRYLFERKMQPGKGTVSLGKIILYGAGQNGRLLAQRLLSDPNRNRDLLGFIDDDPAKQSKFIVGLQVLGNHAEAPALLENTQCTDLIVAISEPPAELMRELLILCRTLNIRLQKISHTDGEALFRKVDLADLLNRPTQQIDVPSIKHLLENKVVMVTGAGGTIGSELARQISQFSPKKLLLLDHSEFALYEIDRELRPQTQDFSRTIPLLVDIKDHGSLENAFATHKPEVVFHAAAYKHVHLVEANVPSSVLNNIEGTKNLLNMCEKFSTSRFVMISSDKAVNPVGAMGATKRACEMLTTEQGVRLQKPYSSVRFGNVLGSSGSLIPILKQQIESGGPVTITHPDMTRYFMLIPEAVSLVLMSATLSEPGDINVLKMGEPIKILDLARNLLTIMGQTEESIGIAFTGVRPGEKMFEELYITGDELATRHSDILTVPRQQAADFSDLQAQVTELIHLAQGNSSKTLERLLKLVRSGNKGFDTNIFVQ